MLNSITKKVKAGKLPAFLFYFTTAYVTMYFRGKVCLM